MPRRQLASFSRIGGLAALVPVLLLGIGVQSQTDARPSDADQWKAVESALHRTGQVQPGGVYKFGMPRSDLHVRVGGVEIKPALALGSWAAFKKSGAEALVAGDLVLTESEVAPVMSRLQAGGIEQTALHNHLLGETPHVMYMHIHGHGNAVKLAQTLYAALALTATPALSQAKPGEPPSLNAAPIDRVLGQSGKMNGGVLQFSVPRREQITDQDEEVPPAMGVATAINFQTTGSGKAAISGDFVLLAGEVNPVIRTLRDHGIEVTALHSHMLTEEPRLFFMHFWANDDSTKLAQALRAALDKTNSQK